MNSFGYLGIFFLIFIENIFPPIPSEIILSLGGFLTTVPGSTMSIFGVIIFATLGSVLGAVVLYYLGKLVNKNRIDIFLEKKWVKRLGFKKKEIDKTFVFFEKWENIAILFGRCIPIIRSLISIPAGMTNMKMGAFLIYTTIGSLIWNTLLVVAGAILGENWGLVVQITDKYKNIILIILGLVAIYFLYKFFIKKNKKEV